jgi:methylated-DNA-[protein]-cysteine S-methyltransferase
MSHLTVCDSCITSMFFYIWESGVNLIHIQYHASPIGEMMFGSFQGKLCLLNYKNKKSRSRIDNRIKAALAAEFVEQSDDVLDEAMKQFDSFLNRKRQQFDLPTLLIGSDFQKQVWQALMNVPYGATASYLNLAKAINNEKAVRAVANANGANALSIIIPCHRIIGSNGRLVGYGGGLEAKQHLIDLEQMA